MDSTGNSAPPSGERDRTLAYVHFPWCLKKCPYCDFTSYAETRERIPHDRYAAAVISELGLRSGDLGSKVLGSIFFGGGTPSLWEPHELGRVVESIRNAFGDVDEALEVTVECNPSSLDRDRARALLDQGVNRLSIGVQSLDPKRLEFLGRLHHPTGALSAIEQALSAGIPRVSGDLMFGVAGGSPQSPEDAAREAAIVASTGVTHVSAYGLTIEPGTQFGELARRGRLPIASDDRISDCFLAVEAELESRGLRHYEVSNYALPGDECRHNLGYWRGSDYLGLGCGAVGMTRTAPGRGRRYRNHVAPALWMSALERGELAEVESEPLDGITLLRERIMTGLRLDDWFDLGAAGAALEVDALTPDRVKALDSLERAQRIVRDGTRIRIPREARLHSDGIAAALF